MKKKLILASGSPRRSELLRQIEIPFTVVLAGVEEHVTGNVPSEVVCELSRQKCHGVADRLQEEAIVLGADTVVALDGEILGKPSSEQDAERMLAKLQGRTHEVHTGVTLIDRNRSEILREETFSVCTKVRVHPMTDTEIRWYVETQEPMDKAGAYGAQGPFARFIEGFEGDYCNVIGLPVHAVYQKLMAWNLIEE